jgi:ribosome-associated toxin RatA of RatAB toxin-antitoxin module
VTVIHRSALVPYGAHEMYELVADVESYPRFLPWCGGARVLSRDEDVVVAAVDIAYGGVHKTFTTRNLMQPGKMLEIRLVEGPFSHLHGHWRFDELGENGSRISLDLDFEFSNRLIAAAISPVFTRIANQLVDGFVRRAHERYGKRIP